MQEEAMQEIELELPEEEKEEEVVEEVVEEQEAAPEQPKDELDTISESVQKRIDKLTYKMREAERQRDEAVNYAKTLSQDKDSLKEKLKTSDTTLFKEYDNRIQSDLQRAKDSLKIAQESGDAEAITAATENLSRAAAESENLKRISAQQELKQEAEAKVVEQPVEQQIMQQPTAAPDPKAEAWADKNEWFGKDQTMTFAAFGVHKDLVESGVDPSSDRYYEELDKNMREYFPHKFSNEQSKPVSMVAASSRGATGKKSTRKIKLTPSQVAIAKRLNVPLEEYAKHIEEGV